MSNNNENESITTNQFVMLDNFLNSDASFDERIDKFFTLSSLLFVPLFIAVAWFTHGMISAIFLGLTLSVLVTFIVTPKNTIFVFQKLFKQKERDIEKQG